MESGVFNYRLRLLFFVCLLVSTQRIHAQQMIFCETTDHDGKAIHPGTTFTMEPKGGYVQVLVKPAKPLNGTWAVIDLFKVDAGGKEVFENSRRFAIENGWMWFAQRFTFYKSGDYVVYAYDEEGNLLATSRLTMHLAQGH